MLKTRGEAKSTPENSQILGRNAQMELEKFLGKTSADDGESQGKNRDMVVKLRELVATINETAIMVDSAAKSTASTATHMARAADTQTRENAE